MSVRLLLVEDDPLQSEAIVEGLEGAFPDAEVKHIRTEKEFIDRIDEIVRFKPDAAIFDVMLRWADPDDIVAGEIPEVVTREKHYRAGLRCQQMLARQMDEHGIPFFLYTILEEADLSEVPPGLTHVRKGPDIQPLLIKLRRWLEPS